MFQEKFFFIVLLLEDKKDETIKDRLVFSDKTLNIFRGYFGFLLNYSLFYHS